VEAVILYPAIDLNDGACVRLKRGDMNAATVFNTDPAAQARSFADAGCRWLHVVDLDGAIEGRSVNGPAVDAIIAAVKVPVQLGGGIRDMAAIEFWLSRGVARVILGTAALRDPGLVKAACKRFPKQVAVGIDARNGLVAVSGWTETSQMTAADLAAQFEDAGVAAIIHTDIDRDGVLGGPNTAATAALARAVDIPVIVSGGVSSLDDLAAIKAEKGSGIAGAIVGRALYDGRIELRAALVVLEA
jgi:phosphoribosylformimino-5-aminoimidazole carboxamide ribotide isomerase